MRLFKVLMALIERISAGDQFLQIGPILIQWGYISVTTQPSAKEGYWSANQQLTFPRTFSAAPNVFFTDDLGGSYVVSNGVGTLSASGMTIKHIDTRNATTDIIIYWLAIGKA